MAATASATVAIKLKVEGEASVKQALNRIEGRFAALDAKTKGMDNRLNSISTALDRNSTSIENHGSALEKHGERYDKLDAKLVAHKDRLTEIGGHYKDFNSSLGDHRNELKNTSTAWGDAGKSLSQMRVDIRDTKTSMDGFGKSVHDLHVKKLIPLDHELQKKSEDFRNLRTEMSKTNREFGKSESSIDKVHRSASRLGNDNKDGIFSKMFQRGMKFVKLFGIEFVAMSATVAAFKGALFLGEMAMKGFNAALAGVGIAAGTAVAALSAFLAAQRELQVAKLSPFFAQNQVGATGPSNMYTQVSGIVGARQLQMFDQKTLGGIATEAAKSGDASKMTFRAMIDDLADFAIVATDPNKALTALVSNFMKAGKEGKITADMFKEISEASPEIVKGFEEMYGGSDKLKSALSSGKVNVNDFMEALNSGRLKSVEPFREALEGVNNTLIGSFKGSIAQLKEQLVEIGMPLVDVLKRPLLVMENEIRVLLMRIGPVIQRTFGQMFDGMGGRGGGLQRFMDRLAILINENLPRLLNVGKKVQSWARTIGDLFGRLGGYLRRMTASWDTLYNKILKPIGIEIGRTFNHLVEAFGKNINSNAEFADSFAARINDIGEGVRKLIDGFMHLKNALAPIIDTFTRLLQIFSKLLGAIGGFGQTLAAAGLTGLFMGRGGRRGRNGQGGGGGGGGIFGAIMAPFMFPFGGFGGGQQRTGGGGGFNPLATYRSAYSYAMQRPADPMSNNPRRDARIFARQNTKLAAKEFFTEGSKRFFNRGTIANFAKVGIPLVASMAGGLISGKSSKTDTTAQAIGGALSGAGTGAMIGSMIAPGVGTAVGAVVGWIAGGVTGFLGAKGEQKRLREEGKASIAERIYAGYQVNDIENINAIVERAQSAYNTLAQGSGVGAGTYTAARSAIEKELPMLFLDVMTGIESGAITGDIVTQFENLDFSNLGEQAKFLEDLMASGQMGDSATITEEAAKNYITQIGYIEEINALYPELASGAMTYNEVLTETRTKIDEATLKSMRLEHNVSALSEVMGMTGREAQGLASSMDLDLSASFLNMDNVLQALGYSTDDFANRATAAGRILRDVLSPIEESRAKRDLASRFDAAGKAITDVRISSMEDATIAAEDYVEANTEVLLGQYQRGEFATYEQFTNATRQSYSQLLADIGAAYGTDSANYQALKTLSDQVIAGITSRDLGTRMQYDPTTALSVDERLAELTRPIIAGGGTYDTAGTVVKQAMMNFVEGLGLTATEETIDTLVRGEFATQAESIGANVDRLIEAMTRSLENIKVNLDGRIEVVLNENGNITSSTSTFNASGGGSGGGAKASDEDFDTSTPRVGRLGDTVSSRLGRTLAKHASFDSMLSGSRSITSAFRTNNLGSINSDHITGNAYDLTGDNLGQYATNVNDAGGFAEFHGSAGSRHLHVVPPQGDASTPASTVSAMDGGGVVINAPITINAKDGQSAREVAMIAVEEIKRLERTARERR